MNLPFASSAARRAPFERASRLLYADKGVIVVNKPSGLVCQTERASQNAFDALLEDVKRKLGLETRPVQVHRLDKNTTGALLLGRSPVHARAIAQQFQNHTIKKSYLVLVRGGRKTFPGPGRGTINAPLRPGTSKMLVDDRDGKPALTDWEVLGSSDKVPLSLLRLSLHSGIKHQLRVHLASILQAPVLGDTTYSTKPPPPEILKLIPSGISVMPRRHPSTSSESEEPSADLTEADGTPRMFLHAAHVEISRYRTTGGNKRFTLGVSAPLPDDFVAVCEAAGLLRLVPRRYIDGGLEIDGESVPLDREIEGVQGRWLG